MSPSCSLSWYQARFLSPSITTSSLFDFLAPALYQSPAQAPHPSWNIRGHAQITSTGACSPVQVENYFFTELARVCSCNAHKRPKSHLLRRTAGASFPRSNRSNRLFVTYARKRREALRWHGDSPRSLDEPDLQVLEKRPDPGGGDNDTCVQQEEQRPVGRGFFDYHPQWLAKVSRLPTAFFHDVSELQRKVKDPGPEEDGWDSNETWPMQLDSEVSSSSEKCHSLEGQLKLLATVRDLEEKLAQAKDHLHTTLRTDDSRVNSPTGEQETTDKSLTLNREDYKGLVDLYYYTHKNRFTPEAPDYSPTPQFVEDYSFKLSEDFAGPEAFAKYYDNEDAYESPLKELEKILKSKRLREISVMQKFVELLLDERSSNRALFEVYQKLPSPGVAFLPKGIIRVFLQRMSTPWAKSKNSMIRYLSLIDDMQKAKLPISRSEWSSAIYLAGRSFGTVTQSDLAHAFRIWRQMEKEAGVKASNVTFNILFDIAIRAGKYVLADNILREMHDRGLRLNRLGRVSLIYYHGLREDGDAIRKTYRDFVDAGEIVDTLVLNCVIASLMNAGEPAAAEQTYERMKDLQSCIMQKKRADGSDLLYRRYPRSGGVVIDRELASNALGRVLVKAGRLRTVLPEHHQKLQDSMPLRPDHSTFRAMISYHANVSGDLNRLTVLMNEMIEIFGLPVRTINFQLLFKGFALHGKMRNPDATWNAHRLELAWDACRTAIKNGYKAKASPEDEKPAPSLPSAKAAETILTHSVNLPELPKRKRLDPWTDLVLDLAAFSQERRKPIERIHAQLFDDEIKIKTTGFKNPFFKAHPEQPSLQKTYYPLGDAVLDNEEGEYTLPGPAEAIQPIDRIRRTQEKVHGSDEERFDPDEVRVTRGLVCWLLRAYTRCTGSRERVERIWNSVRLLWHPHDEIERESVLKVLRRCLKDCDLYGDHML